MFTVNSPEFNIGGPCDLLETIISSRMLGFQVVMDKSYGNSSSLPGPVALVTEKQQQLVAVGDYECPPGMSVNCCRGCEREVLVKRLLITHKFVGKVSVECRKEEESCWSVCIQV